MGEPKQENTNLEKYKSVCKGALGPSVKCTWHKWAVREGFLPVLLKLSPKGSQKKNRAFMAEGKYVLGKEAEDESEYF